jgi:type I restriction enzyme, S subunit
MSIDTASITFPQVWEEFDLGSLVANVRESARITKDEKYELWSVPSFSDGNPEYVTGAEIGSGKLLVKKDDVLISKINPRINRVWMVTEPKSSGLIQVASPEWLVARVKDHKRVLVPFLAFYLSSPVFRDWISSASSSVTGSHSRAKAGQILEQIVPVPPLEEQVKIVEILEEQISRLDAAIVSVRSARDKAANFRRSLLHAAFTGSLTGHDTSTCSLPESWQQSELGKIAKWGSGGTPKSGTRTFYGGEIPWAVIGDLTESWVSETTQTITKAGLEKSSAKIIEPGTVMLAMYGASIGRTGIAAVNMATNQAIAFAVPVDGVMDNQYLLKYIQSQKEDFVRAGQGGAQPNISQTVIKPWPIPVPPIEEQKRIVVILEEQLSRLDAALATADAIERKASATRRSLLHAAFTGELTKKWREGANV